MRGRHHYELVSRQRENEAPPEASWHSSSVFPTPHRVIEAMVEDGRGVWDHARQIYRWARSGANALGIVVVVRHAIDDD